MAPPLALYPSQRLQQEALHGAFKGSICASAVAGPFVPWPSVLNAPLLKGIEHGGSKCTIDYQSVRKSGMLNTPWSAGIEHTCQELLQRYRQFRIRILVSIPNEHEIAGEILSLLS